MIPVTMRLASILTRSFQDFPGRFRLSRQLLAWLRSNGHRLGSCVIRTRHGFDFRADLSDWLGQYVFINGTYEPATALVFEKLITTGGHVLDIGANAGFFTLLSATLAGNSGKVWAFEPIPSVQAVLGSNIALNSCANIQIDRRAASQRSGTATIFEGPAGHKGTSSLRSIPNSTQSIEINTVAIDDLLDRIENVDFVKIDVEGAELLVLMGMERMLERDQPRLVIEFTDQYLRSFNHTASDMLNWLDDHGYNVFRITDNKFIELDTTDSSLPAQYNCIACHEKDLDAKFMLEELRPMLNNKNR